MNSASLCSLAGRYDNPMPTQFLAPIDCLKIPAVSNELTRGPPDSELVKHFCLYIGGVHHRRKSATCPKYGMVWLYPSPLQVGRRAGGNFLVQMISTCLHYV
jgi:hypothetical protein